jgi:hypothetical protein
LVHLNGAADKVIDADFIDRIIDIGALLAH